MRVVEIVEIVVAILAMAIAIIVLGALNYTM
jgi:hypothetical protein